MAVTKIKAIRGTLSKAIAYILNPEKTDEKLLVSSYGCASETAAREFEWTRKIAEQKGMNPVRIIARHVIQSFEIGEVTPELAHEIGKQFADEILGGKYEYVLTTHIDKDHVHNHLIFNAVDFVDYHAYKSYKRIYMICARSATGSVRKTVSLLSLPLRTKAWATRSTPKPNAARAGSKAQADH